MEDHSRALVPRCQVYCRDSTNALAIQDDVLRTDTIPAQKRTIPLKQKKPKHNTFHITDAEIKLTKAEGDKTQSIPPYLLWVFKSYSEET